MPSPTLPQKERSTVTTDYQPINSENTSIERCSKAHLRLKAHYRLLIQTEGMLEKDDLFKLMTAWLINGNLYIYIVNELNYHQTAYSEP